MKKVKTFFYVFRSSLLPHQPFYHKLIKTKFSFSLKYFLFLSIIVYLVFVCIYAFKFNLFQNFSLASTNFYKSLAAFPDDLIISIKNGKLTTNYNRPYFMWMDNNQKKILLLVIDENGTQTSIKDYNALTLLTHEAVISRSLFDKNKYIINSFDKDSIIIDKAKVEEINDILKNVISTIYLLMPFVFIILLPLIVIIVNFLYLLLASIVVHFFAKYYFKGITLRKTLQIAFHAFTLPLLVNYILGIIDPRIAILPITFFALTFLFLSFAIHECHYVVSPHHKRGFF
ncbi:MAG: DUF1189 family protein [Candidatus Roizmanbacteria bacterium]|nr:MAG: DUF1189 family protein [Candidatus Roizmanbacteria bacterium]